MSDVSGIPNLGFGGGGYFGGIPNQQPAMSADQINASMWGRYSPQQAQATLNNIYGAQGFGGQTAAYAGLGAAYGRATGGFRPVAQGPASPSGTVTRGANLPAVGGYEDIDWMKGGSQGARPSSGLTFGGAEDIAWYLGGGHGERPSIMARGSGDQMGPSGTAGGQTATPHNQMFRMPAANPSYFNPGIYAGSQGSFGIPYRGRSLPGDIGFSRQPSYPNIGYNPGMQNWFANPGMRPSPMGSTFEQPGFDDFPPIVRPRQIPSPYGPGGYPPMEPVPSKQGNLNWFGGPSASS